MLQTKDLFGAVDAYMSHQHDSEALLRGDSLGGAGSAPSSSADAKGGKGGGGEGSGSKEDSDEGGGGKGGGGKGGGGKGPSLPTTARRKPELKAHAPTTALAGRLAGCVCSLLRLQLAQLVLRVEALVVTKDANGGGVKGESRKAAAKKMKTEHNASSCSQRRSAGDEDDEDDEAEEAEEAEEVAGALGDDEAAVRELLMTSDGF
jgi:hypothetical protein